MFPKNRQQGMEVENWHNFVAEHFSEDAILKKRLWDPHFADREKPRFDIPQPSIARYFLIQFESGIEKIHVATSGTRQKDLGNGSQFLSCPWARFIYSYTNGVQVRISTNRTDPLRSNNTCSSSVQESLARFWAPATSSTYLKSRSTATRSFCLETR